MMDMNTTYNRIIAPKMNEDDITGRLLEKHLDGVSYNEVTKELSISIQTIEAIEKKDYSVIH